MRYIDVSYLSLLFVLLLWLNDWILTDIKCSTLTFNSIILN